MKILYVHGYGSTANSESSKLLKKVFEENGVDCEVVAPAFSLNAPDKAYQEIMDWLSKEGPVDYVVTSSLGAFYTMQIAYCKKVLINPVLSKDIEKNIKEFPEASLEQLKVDEHDFFNRYFDSEYRLETYIVFGEKDDVADNKEFFCKYYKDHTGVASGMSHRLDEAGAKQIVDYILNKSLNKE